MSRKLFTDAFELPRATGDRAQDAIIVTWPRDWVNEDAHLHFFTDFAGPEGVLIRVAYLTGSSVAGVEWKVAHRDAVASFDCPPGTQAACIVRVSTDPDHRPTADPDSDKAPVGFRIDAWSPES